MKVTRWSRSCSEAVLETGWGTDRSTHDDAIGD